MVQQATFRKALSRNNLSIKECIEDTIQDRPECIENTNKSSWRFSNRNTPKYDPKRLTEKYRCQQPCGVSDNVFRFDTAGTGQGAKSCSRDNLRQYLDIRMPYQRKHDGQDLCLELYGVLQGSSACWSVGMRQHKPLATANT